MIVAVRRLANTVNDAMDLRGKAGYRTGHCKAAGGCHQDSFTRKDTTICYQ